MVPAVKRHVQAIKTQKPSVVISRYNLSDKYSILSKFMSAHNTKKQHTSQLQYKLSDQKYNTGTHYF